MKQRIANRILTLTVVTMVGISLSVDKATASQSVKSSCRTNKASAVRIGKINFAPGDVVSVDSEIDQFDYPNITFTFSINGRRKFEAAQKGMVGKFLPICFGQKMIANPVLNEKVSGDAVQFSGPSKEENDQIAEDFRIAFKLK